MNSKMIKTLTLIFVLSKLLTALPAKFDLLIRNGQVYSGDGSAAVRTDIGIKNGRIGALGQLAPADAEMVIDASGLVVAPGFIDVHTHVDGQIVNLPTADNYVLQGVTTVIGGNCGSYPLPLSEIFDKLQKSGIAINFGSLAGHNTIRMKVMDGNFSEPTSKEMEEMKALLDQEMRAGAMGFSTGLEYIPGMYAKTGEIMNLAAVAGSYGGVYATHLRNEDLFIHDAVQEAIAIGEAHRMTVQISHIKLCRDDVWGRLDLITEPINAARARGVRVFTDQYPYTASISASTLFFPNWALDGGQERFVARLQDPAMYIKIRDEIIEKKLTSKAGVNKLRCFIINNYEDKSYIGKNLEEILVSRKRPLTLEDGADLIIDIQKNGGAGFTAFQMSDADVEGLMKLEYNMIASDGWLAKPGTVGVHCRSYGTFPRVIRRYVLEKRIITLPDAIRKMTSLPAKAFGLVDRGMIKPGLSADIVILDLDKINDLATYQNPFLSPEGVRHVWVNGVMTVRDGVMTGALAGRIVYGPGKRSS